MSRLSSLPSVNNANAPRLCRRLDDLPCQLFGRLVAHNPELVVNPSTFPGVENQSQAHWYDNCAICRALGRLGLPREADLTSSTGSRARLFPGCWIRSQPLLAFLSYCDFIVPVSTAPLSLALSIPLAPVLIAAPPIAPALISVPLNSARSRRRVRNRSSRRL